ADRRVVPVANRQTVPPVRPRLARIILPREVEEVDLRWSLRDLYPVQERRGRLEKVAALVRYHRFSTRQLRRKRRLRSGRERRDGHYDGNTSEHTRHDRSPAGKML